VEIPARVWAAVVNMCDEMDKAMSSGEAVEQSPLIENRYWGVKFMGGKWFIGLCSFDKADRCIGYETINFDAKEWVALYENIDFINVQLLSRSTLVNRVSVKYGLRDTSVEDVLMYRPIWKDATGAVVSNGVKFFYTQACAAEEAMRNAPESAEGLEIEYDSRFMKSMSLMDLTYSIFMQLVYKRCKNNYEETNISDVVCSITEVDIAKLLVDVRNRLAMVKQVDVYPYAKCFLGYVPTKSRSVMASQYIEYIESGNPLIQTPVARLATRVVENQASN